MSHLSPTSPISLIESWIDSVLTRAAQREWKMRETQLGQQLNWNTNIDDKNLLNPKNLTDSIFDFRSLGVYSTLSSRVIRGLWVYSAGLASVVNGTQVSRIWQAWLGIVGLGQGVWCWRLYFIYAGCS